mmetsp:Transcript_27152/g.43675  ORF Transcript_27152/g.43675 Transcript_27152/m.43675 type:complete len:127 (-) Transcript_27152:1471-1851(-)
MQLRIFARDLRFGEYIMNPFKGKLRRDENFEKWVLDSFTIEKKSKKRHSSVVEKKSINKKVLSVKRRQNVSIPLKSMGISASEILNALTEMETGILTEENLERIQAIYPTDKELKEIKMDKKCCRS